MKDDSKPRHLTHEQAAPTVLHHDHGDQTLLYQWFVRAASKGPKFWLLAGGTAAVILVLAMLSGGLSKGKDVQQSAWTELMLSKSVEDQFRVAETYPETKAASWALLQAAEGRFREGLDNLPSNTEAAGPLLNRARELFEQAERDAPAGAPQKRLAALGVARTLEARNELPRAIEQYQAVAEAYPDTPEGKLATALAERLKKPESVEFYRQLYAYKAPEASLPPSTPSLDGLLSPGGSMPLNLPTLPGLPPALDAPTTPSPEPKTEDTSGELPESLFEP